MKSFSAAFAAEKSKKTGICPVWILKLTAGGTDYYMSDNAIALPGWQGGVTTRPWVARWGQIQEGLSGAMGEIRISDFDLSLLIDPAANPNMETLATGYPLETSPCSLYLWWFGLDPATAPPQELLRGYVRDVSIPSDTRVRLSVEDETSRLHRYLGTRVTRAAHPDADPDDVGKIIPILFGSVKKMPALAVTAGVQTSLPSNHNATTPTLTVSDATGLTAGKIIQVDAERMLISSVSGSTLTVVRGYDNTAATNHLKGAIVWEVRGEFVYLIADHPVDSIDKAYGRVGESEVDISAIATGYTGHPGDEHPDHPGRAVLTLPGYITISQAVSLLVNDGISLSDTLGILDTLTVNDGTGISDLLTITDGTGVTSSIGLSDLLTIVDGITVANGTLALADDLTIVDNAGVSHTLSLSDTLTINDGTGVSNTLTIADLLTITDGITVANGTLTLADDLTLTDDITVGNGTIAVENLLNLLGEIIVGNGTLSVSDLITVSDNITVNDGAHTHASSASSSTFIPDWYDTSTQGQIKYRRNVAVGAQATPTRMRAGCRLRAGSASSGTMYLVVPGQTTQSASIIAAQAVFVTGWVPLTDWGMVTNTSTYIQFNWSLGSVTMQDFWLEVEHTVPPSSSGAIVSKTGGAFKAGGASLAGSVSKTGSLTLGGTVGITGAVAKSGSVTLGGSLGLTGGVAKTGSVTRGGSLGLTGGVAKTGSVTRGGTLGLAGGVDKTGSVTRGGTLGLTGGVAKTGGVTRGGTLGLTGGVAKTGSVTRGGGVAKTGSVTRGGTIGLTGTLSKSGTVTLSGNSTANTLVGDTVLVDVTRTLTPAQVVDELLALCGDWPATTVVGDLPPGYTLNGAITGYRRALDWLDLIAWHLRCHFRLHLGQPRLIVRPDTPAPVRNITACRLNRDGTRALSRHKTSLDEVINNISVLYDRDWSKPSGDETAYSGAVTATDAASIADYGDHERPEQFRFDFVTSQAMAESLRDFYLTTYKRRRWVHEFDVFLDHAELEFADAITLDFLSGQTGTIQQARHNPGDSQNMDVITLVVEV